MPAGAESTEPRQSLPLTPVCRAVIVTTGAAIDAVNASGSTFW
jgi:hypothetical protein